MSAFAPSLSPKEKSTTVRPDYARVPSIVRVGFKVGSRLFPSMAAAAAEHVFFRPHLRSARVPRAANKQCLKIDGQEIAAYTWGKGSSAVLLIHGWEGSAAQMASMALALAADGHRVIAIDLPAHGRSTGSQTSLPEVANVVGEVANRLGPICAVVGHSFGAVAAMVVANDLSVGKLVTIGGPSSLHFVIESFAVALGCDGVAQDRFRQRLERRFGHEMWQQFSPRELAGGIDGQALIIHDTNDRAVPYDQAQTLADVWLKARLFTTNGLGHYRVLRSPEVHRAICSFLCHGESP